MKTIRLAPTYDIISTMIYESSTENMALSIGGIYNIHDISREQFKKEAKNIGLGSKLAIKRFDNMVSNFEGALRESAEQLRKQGFEGVEDIAAQILQKGGMHLQ